MIACHRPPLPLPRPLPPQGPTWTRLAATVPASTAAAPSRTIVLREAVAWTPGAQIVLVSTYWKDELANQNEARGVWAGAPAGVPGWDACRGSAGGQAGVPPTPPRPHTLPPTHTLPPPPPQVLTVASVSADGLSVTVTTNIVYSHYGGEYQVSGWSMLAGRWGGGREGAACCLMC